MVVYTQGPFANTEQMWVSGSLQSTERYYLGQLRFDNKCDENNREKDERPAGADFGQLDIAAHGEASRGSMYSAAEIL
jgi:hypothetical protein